MSLNEEATCSAEAQQETADRCEAPPEQAAQASQQTDEALHPAADASQQGEEAAQQTDEAAQQTVETVQQAKEPPKPPAMPRHIVKKLIVADADVQRVSADAVWLLAEASRLFLQSLAVKGAAAAAARKRKTIQLQDFVHLVRCDKRLVEAGMKDIWQNKPAAPTAAAAVGEATQAAGDQEDEQPKQQEGGKRKKARPPSAKPGVRAATNAELRKAKQAAEAASTHKITTFFVRDQQ